MISVELFKKEHLDQIQVQQRQTREEMGEELKDATLFTLFDGDKVQAIIGFVRQTKTRVVAVSLLAQDCGRNMVSIVRAMKRCIRVYQTERVEMLVKTDFPQAHRLAKILGFEREGTLRKFFEGQNYDMYARVK